MRCTICLLVSISGEVSVMQWELPCESYTEVMVSVVTQRRCATGSKECVWEREWECAQQGAGQVERPVVRMCRGLGLRQRLKTIPVSWESVMESMGKAVGRQALEKQLWLGLVYGVVRTMDPAELWERVHWKEPESLQVCEDTLVYGSQEAELRGRERYMTGQYKCVVRTSCLSAIALYKCVCKSKWNEGHHLQLTKM